MHLSPGATGPLKFRATLQSSSGPQAPYAKICRAFMSWSWTLELSPPQSQRMAANANWLVWTCWTPLGWSLECITWISCTLLTQSWTAELSPPEPRWPYLPKDSKANIAANAPVPGRHRAFDVSCDTSKFQWPPGSLCKNLPRVYELILNFGAVTATISKDGSKCKLVGLNLLNTLGLVTQSWTAELSPPEPCWPYLPRDSKANIAANAPVPGRQRNFEVSCDTSKFRWPPGSLSKNLPRIYELILNFGAVTATSFIVPWDKPQSTGYLRCC